MNSFISIHKDIKQKISKESGILDLFHLLRYFYVNELFKNKSFKVWFYNVSENVDCESIKYVESCIKNETKEKLTQYIQGKKLNWGDCNFHIQHRIEHPNDFYVFVVEILRETILRYKGILPTQIFNSIINKINEENDPLSIIESFKDVLEIRLNNNFFKFIKLSEKIEDVQKAINNGYRMSILPLNMLLPVEVLIKYVPESDYFEKYPYNINPDPYGHEINRIRDNSGLLLGTRKFQYSFLMDIQSFCPIGCVGCYKTYYTREKEGEQRLGLSPNTLETQAKKTLEWLNSQPQVYDIIISGGEPLLIDLDNSKIKLLFGFLEKATHLKIIRICTGLIFQGLPFRIEDALLDIIENFCQTTGKRFTFQAHLSNHYQFTPEALFAIRKIRKRGFNIYSQVPIQEGINFFRDDMNKSIEFLTKLGRFQVKAEVEPYKYILDMHPRTQKRYVPLEKILPIWRRLAESHIYPELERPRTLSILCNKGNIILSWYMSKHMKKIINKEKSEVIYQIPAITGISPEEQIIEYWEPLIEGVNDDPNSLSVFSKVDKKKEERYE